MSSLGVLTTTAEAVELDEEDCFFRTGETPPKDQMRVLDVGGERLAQESQFSLLSINCDDATFGRSKVSSFGDYSLLEKYGLTATSSSSTGENETRSCTTTTDSWDEGVGSASEDTTCDIDVDSFFFGGASQGRFLNKKYLHDSQDTAGFLNPGAKIFAPKHQATLLTQEQQTLLQHAQNLFGSQHLLQQRFDNHYLQQPDVLKPPPNAKLVAAALAAPPMRQLPCKSWLATGSCGYGGRCVFLHDKRCTGVPVQVMTKRKAREDPTQDGLFWPTLRKEAVCGQLDRKGMPLVSQPYIVPSPAQPELVSLCMKPPPAILEKSFSRHQYAVHSVYEHFLDVLFVATDCPVPPRTIDPDTFDPTCVTNTHMGGRKRLPIFVTLSQGISVYDTPLPASAKDAGAKFGLRPSGTGPMTVASVARLLPQSQSQLAKKKQSMSSSSRDKSFDRGSRGVQEREREQHKGAAKRGSASSSSSSAPETDMFSYSYWKN